MNFPTWNWIQSPSTSSMSSNVRMEKSLREISACPVPWAPTLTSKKRLVPVVPSEPTTTKKENWNAHHVLQTPLEHRPRRNHWPPQHWRLARPDAWPVITMTRLEPKAFVDLAVMASTHRRKENSAADYAIRVSPPGPWWPCRPANAEKNVPVADNCLNWMAIANYAPWAPTAKRAWTSLANCAPSLAKPK